MGAEAASFDPAVLLVPFPAQGHVTPMLHLARALAAHGVAPTVAVPDFIHRRIAASGCCAVVPGVALASIPSGIAEEVNGDDSAPGFGAIAHSMESFMPAQLERMLARRRPQVACVVVDVLASWAVPVAERCGVPVAGFWPAMLACYRVVTAIPELMERGLISESGTPISSNDEHDTEEDGLVIRGLEILPAQVELRTRELPWLVGDKVTQASRFAFWRQTLRRARSFRWVLVNSFPGEDSAQDVHKQQQQPERKGPSPRVIPVRPALLPGNGNSLSAERTKPQQQQQACGGKSTSPSMWRADASCIGWLDAQRAGSVVYVSFGSWVGPIGPDKVRELALGLEASGRPFLWALKRDAAWRAGLPAGFAERAENEGRGKVVDWAPQEDVLRHAAVGCYLTHCGWNSTAEAIQHGVRLLCCPVAGDQFINCAYITGLWGIGLKLGVAISRDDVRSCIERIVDGEEGRRLQDNVTALRERVVTAEARSMAEKNVKSFVDEIKKEQPLFVQMYSASL